MSSKRRRFSGELKTKVALEALRGERTLQEIASQHQVHPNQVGAWKRQAIEGLVEVFSKGAERRVRDHESEVRDLHAKIGELIVERPAVGRTFLALLRADGGERRDARTDAADRRALPEVPVLRRPSDGTSPAPRGRAYGGRRAGRLMSLMGLQAIYRAPRTSDPHPEHRVYPYLLRGLAIERANHVWCADITYIPVQRGFLYLVAIMDWASRYVLAWRLSNTLDASFCTDALEEVLARHGAPEIFNTDQGSQFTSFAFTGRLQAAGIRISMDGRGRCMDNIFIERLWRSLKYEAIYLHEIADGFSARRLIRDWVRFYNLERPHLALDGRPPAEAYRGEPPVDMMDTPLRALPTSPQAQQQQQEDRMKGILAA